MKTFGYVVFAAIVLTLAALGTARTASARDDTFVGIRLGPIGLGIDFDDSDYGYRYRDSHYGGYHDRYWRHSRRNYRHRWHDDGYRRRSYYGYDYDYGNDYYDRPYDSSYYNYYRPRYRSQYYHRPYNHHRRHHRHHRYGDCGWGGYDC